MTDDDRDKPRADGRRRGRPTVEEPLTLISTRISPREYDRIVKLATKHEMTLAGVLRRLICRPQ